MKKELSDLKEWKRSKEAALNNGQVASTKVTLLEREIVELKDIQVGLNVNIESLQQHRQVYNELTAAQEHALANAEKASEVRQRSIHTLTSIISTLQGIRTVSMPGAQVLEAEHNMLAAMQVLATLRLDALKFTGDEQTNTRETSPQLGPIDLAEVNDNLPFPPGTTSPIESASAGRSTSNIRGNPSRKRNAASPDETRRKASGGRIASGDSFSKSPSLSRASRTGSQASSSRQASGGDSVRLINQSTRTPTQLETAAAEEKAAQISEYPNEEKAREAIKAKISDLRAEIQILGLPPAIQKAFFKRIAYYDTRTPKWPEKPSKDKTKCLEQSILRKTAQWNENEERLPDYYHACTSCCKSKRVCAVLLEEDEVLILPLSQSQRATLYATEADSLTDQHTKYWMQV